MTKLFVKILILCIMTNNEIVVFGHSLVRHLRDYTVRHHLHNLDLSADKYRVFLVGHSGLTVEKAFQEVDVVEHLQPATVVLDLGANDLDSCSDPQPHQVAQSVVEFALHLKLRSKAKVLYIVQAYHRYKPRRKNYEKVLPIFNKALFEWCKAHPDMGIIYYHHRNFNNNWQNYLSADGVHLNCEGNRRYYRSIRGAVLRASSQTNHTSSKIL